MDKQYMINGEIMNYIKPIPKGQIFLISSVEYSDYSICGVYRALEDIDVSALKDKWAEDHPEQMERYHFKEEAFYQDVKAKGLMEKLDCWEWYLGSYSTMGGMHVDESER